MQDAGDERVALTDLERSFRNDIDELRVRANDSAEARAELREIEESRDELKEIKQSMDDDLKELDAKIARLKLRGRVLELAARRQNLATSLAPRSLSGILQRFYREEMDINRMTGGDRERLPDPAQLRARLGAHLDEMKMPGIRARDRERLPDAAQLRTRLGAHFDEMKGPRAGERDRERQPGPAGAVDQIRAPVQAHVKTDAFSLVFTAFLVLHFAWWAFRFGIFPFSSRNTP